MNNTAYLGIGSNLPETDALRNIEAAVDALRMIGCKILRRSPVYMVNEPYFNNVARVETDMSLSDLVAATKKIESDMGRTVEMKSCGIVPIDIDVVVYNASVNRSRDFLADYFKIGYDFSCKSE